MNKYKKKTYWQYAMYKGDEQIAFGTREEICKKTKRHLNITDQINMQKDLKTEMKKTQEE